MDEPSFEYVVTNEASGTIAGQKVTPGTVILLTERQARYYVGLGHLVKVGDAAPSSPGLYFPRDLPGISAVAELFGSRAVGPNDLDTLLRYAGGTDITLTLPRNLPVGFEARGYRLGGGNIVLASAAGATATFVAGYDRTIEAGNGFIALVIENSDGRSAKWLVCRADGAAQPLSLAVIASSGQVLSVGKRYLANLSAGPLSWSMPSAPDEGASVLVQVDGNAPTNPLTLNGNGKPFAGGTTLIVDVALARLDLTFIAGLWRF